jgi:uncharacterized membrane protein
MSAERGRSLAINLNRGVYKISRNWFPWFIVISGLYIGLPWLAPVFMRSGLEKPASAIYFVYSFLCHQLPQRSFFLFGPQASYPLEQIQNAWQNSVDPLVLRQFIGNVEMGYKVAWSDRMISLYTSIPIFAVLWRQRRRIIRPLSIAGLVLLASPMVIDGLTHMISDVSGIGQGFRDTNTWLSQLTGGSLSETFYPGDALGSFNSWMRLITGTLFGAAIVYFSFPSIQASFNHFVAQIEAKFLRAGIEL